ncbi:hypothetical protein [Aestuariivirga sp.]
MTAVHFNAAGMSGNAQPAIERNNKLFAVRVDLMVHELERFCS